MNPIRLLSAPEQVAGHLRSEIARGALVGTMPGANQLAANLGVNAKTVVVALKQLEAEGILVNQGPRRGRLIATRKARKAQSLHIGILLYESSDQQSSLFMEIHHALTDLGHAVGYAKKALTELKMDLPSVERMVKKESFDAWLIVAGSRTVLEWFSQQDIPSFALFGRRNNVSIPSIGPSTDIAFIEALEVLIAQGHHRIVKICRSERRKPNPGKTERNFLEILERHGISTGDYNLPDWEETPHGLQELLSSLFRVTSPTALIVDEAVLFPVVIQFLGAKGYRVPEDVSLFCMESASNFEWCVPKVSHIDWDSTPAIRRILKWSVNVSQGKSDLKRASVPAKFVRGETIGVASYRK